uniref:Secreted protein n=1 Tax=Arundo donax TaxID=35708 RepID=A0A0A9FEF7_ARUDO
MGGCSSGRWSGCSCCTVHCGWLAGTGPVCCCCSLSSSSPSSPSSKVRRALEELAGLQISPDGEGGLGRRRRR